MKEKTATQIRNEARWQEHLRQVQGHRGTLTSYCQAHGVSLATLRYWRAKLEKQSISRGSKGAFAKRLSPFIPVQVITSEVFPQEHRFPDPKWLAEFIVQLGVAQGGRR